MCVCLNVTCCMCMRVLLRCYMLMCMNSMCVVCSPRLVYCMLLLLFVDVAKVMLLQVFVRVCVVRLGRDASRSQVGGDGRQKGRPRSLLLVLVYVLV